MNQFDSDATGAQRALELMQVVLNAPSVVEANALLEMALTRWAQARSVQLDRAVLAKLSKVAIEKGVIGARGLRTLLDVFRCGAHFDHDLCVRRGWDLDDNAGLHKVLKVALGSGHRDLACTAIARMYDMNPGEHGPLQSWSTCERAAPDAIAAERTRWQMK